MTKRKKQKITGSFNHKTIFVAPSVLMKQLSVLSKDGWEAVSATLYHPKSADESPDPDPTFCLVMKKPMDGGLSVNDTKMLSHTIEALISSLDQYKQQPDDVDITKVLSETSRQLHAINNFLGG